MFSSKRCPNGYFNGGEANTTEPGTRRCRKGKLHTLTTFDKFINGKMIDFSPKRAVYLRFKGPYMYVFLFVRG